MEPFTVVVGRLTWFVFELSVRTVEEREVVEGWWCKLDRSLSSSIFLVSPPSSRSDNGSRRWRTD